MTHRERGAWPPVLQKKVWPMGHHRRVLVFVFSRLLYFEGLVWGARAEVLPRSSGNVC